MDTTGTLQGISEELGLGTRLKIAHNLCQTWLFKKAECRLCVDACPVEGCLSVEDGEVRGRSESCTGCGVCTTVCPTGAITFNALSDEDLLERLKDVPGKNIFISCTLGPERKGVSFPEGLSPEDTGRIEVPCLAILKESHHVALLLSGRGVGLDMTRCGGCAYGQVPGVIERTARFAENLLRAAGTGLGPKLFYEMPEKAAGRKVRKTAARAITTEAEYSRREFLTFFRKKAAERILSRSSTEKKTAAFFPADGKVLPWRRAALARALGGIDIPEGAALKEGDFPVRSLSIGPGCVMCRRCEVFCPTGAIERVEGDEEVRVDFNARLCMACHQCREFCPSGAIDYRKETSLGRLLHGSAETLARAELRRCSRCAGTYLPQDGDECPACRKRSILEKRIESIIFMR